jgi:hypothetical protein
MITSACPRPFQLARVSDIRARIPPSPWLSAPMASRQYLIDIVMISSHVISDNDPSAAAASNLPPNV